MDLDLSPVIPDELGVIRESYNLALTKLIRSNEHNIIRTSVNYHGSTIRIEVDIKSDQVIVDKLQSIKDLETKETISDSIHEHALKEAQSFIERIRNERHISRIPYS
jgi:hypothetical protein